MVEIEMLVIGECSLCGKKVVCHTDPNHRWKGSPVLTGYKHDDGTELCENKLGFVRINEKDLLKT